jgi:CheY-like chemotaxis protein
MNQSNFTLLCVDDDKDNCELLTFVFSRQGFQVETCHTMNEALQHIRQKSFNAIILDNHLGETTSLEACQKIRLILPSTPIIFYSGESRQSEIDKAVAAGANAYLVKPNGFDKLTETVTNLISQTAVYI